MESILEKSVEKIQKHGKIGGRIENVIAEDTAKALISFCRQNEEFARAVIDGGSFDECLKFCAKGVNSSSGVSDLAVYQKAAEFYFPGAVVEFRMLIHMSRFDAEETKGDKDAETVSSGKINIALDF